MDISKYSTIVSDLHVDVLALAALLVWLLGVAAVLHHFRKEDLSRLELAEQLSSRIFAAVTFAGVVALSVQVAISFTEITKTVGALETTGKIPSALRHLGRKTDTGHQELVSKLDGVATEANQETILTEIRTLQMPQQEQPQDLVTRLCSLYDTDERIEHDSLVTAVSNAIGSPLVGTLKVTVHGYEILWCDGHVDTCSFASADDVLSACS